MITTACCLLPETHTMYNEDFAVEQETIPATGYADKVLAETILDAVKHHT